MRHTVLLVDDEPKILSALQRLLRDEPYEILTAGNAEEAADILGDTPVDLIVCDEEMPGMPGSEFLARVARDLPDVVRIVLTGHPTLPAALRAINEGRIYQFFTKPCNEIDLAISMRRALEQKDLMAKSRDLLEVTKRQSVLIDEARVLRRLRDLPHKDRTGVIAKEGRPMDTRELVEEMDHEVNKGRALLRSLRDDAAQICGDAEVPSTCNQPGA
jgi:two-component system, probable response regulator PhcQ